MRIARACMAAALCMAAARGEDGSGAAPPFAPAAFEAGEGCRWEEPAADALAMNEHFIAGPRGDRAAWLAALHAYRAAVRHGPRDPVLALDFRGVRAWVRMGLAPARALALLPGERIAVTVEAASVEGNRELCVAFDLHDVAGGANTGWSGVCATLVVPAGGGWHRVSAVVEAPAFAPATQWLRPILGMDATWNAAPGKVRIRAVRFAVRGGDRMRRAAEAGAAAGGAGLDRRLYARPDLAWAARAFTCHFTFMYDRAFYDPEKGYLVETFLEEGEREFGGYDIIVLWQGYPRLGVDPRNQFDMYRDMPGGLAGLRDVARRAHARGVKVFVDYNPWDRGTRREKVSDEEALVELVEAIEADGIFLDTMSAASPSLRERLDRARPGVALAPEGHPAVDQIAMLSLSWAQWLHDPDPPGLLRLKWIEPRHMQHQIKRWDRTHEGEIETAFLNGSGMLVWENVFGTWNPWREKDRRLWRRAAAILKRFGAQFTGEGWDPFYPTERPALFAHRWPGDGVTLFTLLNQGPPFAAAPLVAVELPAGAEVFDLWNGARLRVAGGKAIGAVERLGCIAVVAEERVTEDFLRFLDAQRRSLGSSAETDGRVAAAPVLEPAPAAAAPREACPPGMTLVPGAAVTMHLTHRRRECGCYPDPDVPPEKWAEFLWGSPHDGTVEHHAGPFAVRTFYIDEAAVSNRDFERFLRASGYRPKHPENFLAHWTGGRLPEELADHPVVYVDLDDARAYAAWAGKRLPSEPEWHLAAQGAGGRAWPWGDEFDPARCNSAGAGTMPVRSLPEGRSPFGCYHMSGNVWEWTESVRDDGHTRFAIIRGGGWFQAKGSDWYFRGGPMPCAHHAKFLLMWPGLDRCATIGFRCAADARG